MSLKKPKLTKELVKQFCDKHKIDISDVDMKQVKELYIYQSDVGVLKDKSDYYEMFLYVNFKTMEIEDTAYYFKPHKDLYESDEPDSYGEYTYKAQATLYVPMPINQLKDGELAKLFNVKEVQMKNVQVAAIPANTIEQLETLYKLFFTNLKSYNDMFNSDTFKEMKKTYQQQKEQVKQLNKNIKTFLLKNINIIKKKAELEQDFKE